MRALVLDGWAGYPPFQKRIRDICSHCGDVDVLGVVRDYNLGGPPVVPFRAVARIQRGRYHRRLEPVVRTVAAAARQLRRSRYDVIYCLGFEMGLAGRLACRLAGRSPRIVYEIHDLRDAVLEESVRGRALRAVEAWVLRRLAALVVTSPEYDEHYYRRLRPASVPVVVVENKLLPCDFARERGPATKADTMPSAPLSRAESERPLRIGWFGALRCAAAWEALRLIAAAGGGRFEILLAGDAGNLPGLAAEAAATPHASYLGPYADPGDVASLYDAVDVVWSAGFHGKKSYRWARSCRFYYAGFFGKPVVSEASTAEGAVVAAHDIGLVVDLTDPAAAAAAVIERLPAGLAAWACNMRNMPVDNFVLGAENDGLYELLQDRRTRPA